jgi:hypothetical protein
MPAKKKKLKTGPKPRPAAELVRIYSTSLTPATADHCRKIGDGSVGRGMRTILDEAAKR